ncbi:Ca-activated chloride channel family protein [Streptomyces sp. DvalAA-14]|uniref:VWA domain-containing protein n=1 Tax=unclassified Streptomyces TaxID=2593676 RepID=UPI00081BAA4D|nr:MULTISPECIES: VWA domain-containing protein [unclassified Streptomyces]MYS24874.1 VWA domain-containing protein [Streptomyces sp. SID4948]SCE50167.1 Ca-activated chloride channel family protein [Streptomyces sp. DvalAA-14]
MIIRRLLTTGLGCGLLAVLACGLLPASASADEPAAPQPAPKVELVLDVSGSMKARDIDGQSRMSAAKQAFDDVLDSVPDGVQLGIRTLGANYPGNNRKTGCKDTRQLYPVGPLDRTEAKTAVATLQPTGWTPIGPALTAAANDLKGGNGTRRMVLITDGEDTCNINPCDVARSIAAQGIHLVIDTLGLIPDSSTRNQLSCIAEATGGTYTTVQHRQQLTSKVKQLVDRSNDTTVAPVAVQGGADCAAAPLLKEGLYTDRETFSQNRWYRVAVKPGQELRASVSVSEDRTVNADYGVLLRGVTEHGRELVRDDEGGTGRTDAVSAGIRYPKPHADDGTPPETVCLQVGNSFSAQAGVKTTPGLPVELSIDLTRSPVNPSDVAFYGLGRGWWLLGLLAAVGAVAGLLTGWIARWRLNTGRTD